MAILQQTVFSPRYGFDQANDKVNSFLASGPLAFGKIVQPQVSTGILALATDWGYFMYEETTSDGPSTGELALGIQQYEKKATAAAPVPVSVLKPVQGGIVRTKWVSAEGSASVVAGATVNISDGLFITGASASAGTKGRILNLVTDSLDNAMYDIQIL